MTKKSHVSQKKNALIAGVFLLIPLILFLLWLFAVNGLGDVNESQLLDHYSDYFPAWIKNVKVVFIISIIFSLLAVVYSSKNFRKESLSLRLSMLFVCLAGIFIFLFNIYHLLHN